MTEKISPSKKMNFPQNGRRRRKAVHVIDLNGGAEGEVGRIVRRRSRILTFCLISFVASISCLSPFVTFHLTQRVGMMLFESDLLRLRSSLLSVIICFATLVIIFIIVHILSIRKRKINIQAIIIQKTLRSSIALFSFISAVSYLSIALIVPQIRQIQRMPIATFDCDANLITIENCNQQFTKKYNEGQTFIQTISDLFVNDIDTNNERLLKKLDCLTYNEKGDVEGKNLETPTRFLLHKCGLVCKPQQQQLHQFSDDLNREQFEETGGKQQVSQANSLLQPPYSLNTTTTNNQEENLVKKMPAEENDRQVSMKLCFSGEFTGGSNYKQFCITNLSNQGGHQHDQTMTVGQLNSMLRRFAPIISSSSTEEITNEQENSDSADDLRRFVKSNEDLRSTHYVNPVVQFESNLKNWPHSTSDHLSPKNGDQNWCKFKPVPPFIVNNKPFSDIQCSLEHEYTMTTGPSLDFPSYTSAVGRSDNIYLKKSTLSSSESGFRERCNIQCKVNILYRTQLKSSSSTPKANESNTMSEENHIHYYLPLKPCLLVMNEGDKLRTANYYLLFRSLADSSLILVFILLDSTLLLEMIDTKQSYFEGRKLRLVGILSVITIMPLIVGLIYDLTSMWLPAHSYSSGGKLRKESFLASFISEKLIPNFSELFSRSKQKITISQDTQPKEGETTFTGQLLEDNNQQKPTIPTLIDSNMVPFFMYSIFMFALAINSLSMPIVNSLTPLMRVSSTEELGMSKFKSGSSSLQKLSTKSIEIVEEEKLKVKPKSTDKETKTAKQRGQTMKIFLFLFVTVFMGTQFNLSQSEQTHELLKESHHNSGGENYKSFAFIFRTHSSATLFILIFAILFFNETSVFFNELSPFNSSAIHEDHESKENSAKFFKHQSISLAIYSLRFYAISNLNPDSNFKWLVVFLFRFSELFNFPLIWFSLSTRTHEIIGEHPAYRRKYLQDLGEQQKQQSKLIKSLKLHALIQSLLALIYFALCRLLALLILTKHESSHLYSDNFDWFVTSFYSKSEPFKATNDTLKNGFNQTESGHNSSLYSPLPGERQTYIHASRLFFKYNSVACLVLALILAATFLYVKYQLWSIKRRTLNVFQSNEDQHKVSKLMRDKRKKYKQARFSPITKFHRPKETSKVEYEKKDQADDSTSLDPIDELLSYDLMRINSSKNNTRTIYPKMKSNESLHSDAANQAPRAKILFHYNLKRSDSSSLDTPVTNHEDIPPPEEVSEEEFNQISKEVIASDETEDEAESVSVDVERVLRQRNKRVRLFEAEESWSNKESSSEQSVRPTMIQRAKRPKRTITFAPETTLITEGHNSRGEERQQFQPNKSSPRVIPIQRASPEPSIDDDDHYDD